MRGVGEVSAVGEGRTPRGALCRSAWLGAVCCLVQKQRPSDPAVTPQAPRKWGEHVCVQGSPSRVPSGAVPGFRELSDGRKLSQSPRGLSSSSTTHPLVQAASLTEHRPRAVPLRCRRFGVGQRGQSRQRRGHPAPPGRSGSLWELSGLTEGAWRDAEEPRGASEEEKEAESVPGEHWRALG